MLRLIFLLLFSVSLFAQDVNLDFVKTYGGNSFDIGQAVHRDANNIYITGIFTETVGFDTQSGNVTLISNGQTDVFFAKLDTTGNLLWVKQIGGASNDDGISIITDSSGNIFVLGDFLGTVDFDPSANSTTLFSGSGNMFIAKYDSNGNFLWVTDIPGSSLSVESMSMDKDSSDNLYVTGNFRGTISYDPGSGTFVNISSSNSGNGDDIFICKIDNSGNIIFVRALKDNNAQSEGSGHSIQIDNNSSIYLTGIFSFTVDFDPGSGTFNLTSDGGSNDSDIFAVKLDLNGNFIWAKSFGASNSDIGNDIATDNSGNVYVTGSFRDTVDFNPSPSETNELTSVANTDAFILKLDQSGNYVWAKSFGGSSSDTGNSIALDSNGDVYTTGRFLSTVDFDPDQSTVFNLTSNGSGDIFIHKLDAIGNFMYVKQIGGSGSESVNSIDVDSNFNILIIGAFRNTVDFDPETDVFEVDSNGSRDIFILNLESSSLSVTENDIISNEIVLFPNPTQDYIYVESKKNISHINIYDIQGKFMYKININKTQNQIDVSVLSTGIYLLEIHTDNLKSYKKIIKI
ncbi:SBBP repeat-containing protein [Kordia sp.]|uniref:SBBP repeat-containing protein n=1 Tax=Kordia sp. TaxID=1965332 RepID=UPI003D6ACC23